MNNYCWCSSRQTKKMICVIWKIYMIFSTLRFSNYSINIKNGGGCWAEKRHFTIKPYKALFQFSSNLSTKPWVLQVKIVLYGCFLNKLNTNVHTKYRRKFSPKQSRIVNEEILQEMNFFSYFRVFLRTSVGTILTTSKSRGNILAVYKHLGYQHS